MNNIIDDPINKNIELYYAFFNSFQLLPYKKYQLLKHVKRIKNQMKNSYQKILTTYKR